MLIDDVMMEPETNSRTEMIKILIYNQYFLNGHECCWSSKAICLTREFQSVAVLGNKLLTWDILVTSLMLKTKKKSCNLMNRPLPRYEW